MAMEPKVSCWKSMAKMVKIMWRNPSTIQKNTTHGHSPCASMLCFLVSLEPRLAVQVCVCVWLRIFFLNFQNWVPIVRDAWLVEIQYAYKYLDTIHTCCCILYCTCHVVSLCMLTVHICLTSALNEPVHAWNDKSISFFYPHSNEASSAESKRIYIHWLASGTAVMLPLLMSHIS